MSNELIISVSGLRGIVGQSLTPDVAMRYAAAFAQAAPPGPIVVSRDGRASGAMLCTAVASALCAVGRDVIDAGIAATPTTGVLVRQKSAAGGIQVSASHNPPQYNGLKLFAKQGRVIDAAAGENIRHRMEIGRIAWAGHDGIGAVVECEDSTTEHLRLVLQQVDVKRIRAAKFRVLLDSNHGAGSVLGRRLLEELGCNVVMLGGEPDGQFGHPAEPTAENLRDVCPQVRAEGAAIGFCQDPDADRLAVISENGRYLGEEHTLALCLSHVLRQRRGPVVTNCATSRMARDLAEKYDVPYHVSAVGEANVVDLMESQKAVFGGEGNGGPIDPNVGYVRDSFVGMAVILDAMAARDLPVSMLASELPSYEIHKTKISLPRERISQALDQLQQHFADAAANRMDGLRLDWPDRWLLLRASNTEPIVRIIAEAPTLDAAQRMCREAEGIIA